MLQFSRQLHQPFSGADSFFIKLSVMNVSLEIKEETDGLDKMYLLHYPYD